MLGVGILYVPEIGFDASGKGEILLVPNPKIILFGKESAYTTKTNKETRLCYEQNYKRVYGKTPPPMKKEKTITCFKQFGLAPFGISIDWGWSF